jgi:hypothetical protein
LRKPALHADLGPLPIEDVDGNDDQHSQAGEDGGRVDQLAVLWADVLVEGVRVQRGNTGKEVARQVVASCCGSCVDSVGCDLWEGTGESVLYETLRDQKGGEVEMDQHTM